MAGGVNKSSGISAAVLVLFLAACEEKVPELAKDELAKAVACEPLVKAELAAFKFTEEYKSFKRDYKDVRGEAARREESFVESLEGVLKIINEYKNWDSLRDNRKMALGPYFSCDMTYEKTSLKAAREKAAAYIPPIDYVKEAAAEAQRYWDWMEKTKSDFEKSAKKHTVRVGPNTRIDVYDLKNGKKVTCITTMYPSGPILKCDD